MKKIINKLTSIFGLKLIKYPQQKTEKCWPVFLDKTQTMYENEEKFHSLYEKAQKKTQMTQSDNPIRRQRHYTLNHLLWNAPINQGEICEIGCWRGLSAYQIATYIQKQKINTTFHIFDSFEGLSEIQHIDTPQDRKQNNEKVQKIFACDKNTVQQNLNEFSFIKYYKGWVPERFPEVEKLKFAFVHVDVDLYQPILDCFEFFYPKLIAGGVIVFDDYGAAQFPGAKKAIDQCLTKFNDAFFVPLPSGQAFIIKKNKIIKK